MQQTWLQRHQHNGLVAANFLLDGWRSRKRFFPSIILVSAMSQSKTFKVLTSIRGLLINLTKFFYAISSSKTSNAIVMFFAQLMGMYFVSSVLLMRMNVPPEYRQSITDVLGDLQFKFYHRWFDVIFLISALSSIFFLYLAHKQAGFTSMISLKFDTKVKTWVVSLSVC